MTVYIALRESYQDDVVEGVYATVELAKAAYPDLAWDELQDGVIYSKPYGGIRFETKDVTTA